MRSRKGQQIICDRLTHNNKVKPSNKFWRQQEPELIIWQVTFYLTSDIWAHSNIFLLVLQSQLWPVRLYFYTISAGIVKSICCMSFIWVGSEFIEADITYNETKEYLHLFNVVAFNDVTLDWVVVICVRMDRQDGNAYALAFSKTFQICKADHPVFEPG